VDDGVLDRQYNSSIYLIGKNTTGYGVYQNSNFLWLMQNFAGSVEPVNKVQGQLWFDKSTDSYKMRYFDGGVWKALTNSDVSDTAPENPTIGDFWYRTSTEQLLVALDDTNWKVVAPDGVEGAGITRPVSMNILDDEGANHPSVLIYLDGTVIAIFTQATFTVNSSDPVYAEGFTELFRGLNLRANIGLNSASNLIVNKINAGSSTTAGTITGDWSLTSGSRLTSTYADLAENYEADDTYSPGMVLEFGGTAEVTLCQTDMSVAVAGVISTNPAYVMNEHHQLEGYCYSIALAGRIPCNVKGKIAKGDLLVAGKGGFARAEKNPKTGTVIAKAMEAYDSNEIGQIEVMVWRG
jgi:hypothetical protein